MAKALWVRRILRASAERQAKNQRIQVVRFRRRPNHSTFKRWIICKYPKPLINLRCPITIQSTRDMQILSSIFQPMLRSQEQQIHDQLTKRLPNVIQNLNRRIFRENRRQISLEMKKKLRSMKQREQVKRARQCFLICQPAKPSQQNTLLSKAQSVVLTRHKRSTRRQICVKQ